MIRFLAAGLGGAMLIAHASGASAQAAAPAPAASPGSVLAASPSPPPFLGVPRGNALVAGSMSLAVNGLGQYYNEQPEKGFVMLASLLSFPVAYGVDSLTGQSTMRAFSYAIIAAVKVWSVLDAVQHASPRTPTPTPTPRKPA